ncbi:restriction endonuclease subunit S [Kordiimonas sp.]|uniref:restriction endonuclease subunit S n=1 Tax=Kordiimonas sp. TaxID=1970157 RepID=UPI003A92E8CE
MIASRVALKSESSVITKGTTPTSLGHSFTDDGVPFLRAQNLVDGTISVAADPMFIAPETNEALKRSKIKAGDVLISIAGTIGRAAIVPQDAPEMNCNQAVAIVRPSDRIHHRYLLHWLSSNDAFSQMSKSKVTGVISNLSLGEIGKLEIPLPPLEEQKRIAGILDQAAELCRLRTRALDKLNTLGQAIFHEMFGASLAGSELSSHPPLGDSIRSVTNGLTRRAKAGEQTDVVLRLKDVRQGRIDFSDLARITLQEKEKEKFRIEPGNLLFIRVNGNPDYVGRNAVFQGYDEDVYHNDHIMRVILDTQVLNPTFVSFVLDSRFGRKQIRANMKTSAGQHTINQVGLSAVRLPVPPLETQETFERRLAQISWQRSYVVRGIERANALFASLQHRAFRGEL